MKRVMVKIWMVAVLVGAGLSAASTIDLKYSGLGAHKSVKVICHGHRISSAAGVYLFDKVGGNGPESNYWPDGEKTVFGFCTDLFQSVTRRETTYMILDPADGPNPHGPMGAEKANYLKELWSRYFDSSWVGTGGFTNQQNISAAAFDVAIWEIVYENLPPSPDDWNLHCGIFKVKKAASAVVDLATNWLHSLTGTGPYADLVLLSNCEKQDMLTQVPEPATIGFILLGLVTFGVSRRRN